MVVALERQACAHVPSYCEENVWHLVQTLASLGNAYVVIVAAEASYFPWASQAIVSPGQLVWWDYHVIAVLRTDEEMLAFDLDSRLPFPCGWMEYFEQSCPILLYGALPLHNRPRFRLIPAKDYLAGFWSDRSHMLDAAGAWMAPPPPWPPIQGNGGDFTLARLRDVAVGEWLERDGLLRALIEI